MILERFIEFYRDTDASGFDVVVIGGGITGAATAYTLSLLGYRVCLLEKGDFTRGTSGCTSRMIHGGLRYLKTRQFRLVRESLAERRILGNIAPNFVYPKPMMLFSMDHPKSNKGIFRAGLIAFDALSFDKRWTWDSSKRIPKHYFLEAEEALARAPVLRPDHITGAFVYEDGINLFPERMVLAFVKSAAKQGARVANYTEVIGFSRGAGGRRINGVTVRDNLSGRVVHIPARLVVSCAGPWTDKVLARAVGDKPDISMVRSEGIHIVTRSLHQYVKLGFYPRQGRHLFVVPYRGHSLIGTTDEPYYGDPDDYRIMPESIGMLLGEINRYLREPLDVSDIKYAYGGLRPLTESAAFGTYNASRRSEVRDNSHDGADGLLTVIGGKYTTSRSLADQVARLVDRKFGRRPRRAPTDRLYLYGCEIRYLPEYMVEMHKRYGKRFSTATIEYIACNYGTEAPGVFSLCDSDQSLSEMLTADGEIMAEVVYAARYEVPRTLNDVLHRRSGVGAIGRPPEEIVEKIALRTGAELGWDAARITEEMEAVFECYRILERMDG